MSSVVLGEIETSFTATQHIRSFYAPIELPAEGTENSSAMVSLTVFSVRFLRGKTNVFCVTWLKNLTMQSISRKRGVHVLECRAYSSLNGKENSDRSMTTEKDKQKHVGAQKGPKKSKDFSVIITQGPLGWLKKRFNLWRLKKYFDHDFEEEDFLRGTKQAFHTVSTLVCERRTDELVGLAHWNVIQTIRTVVNDGVIRTPIETEAILAAQVGVINFGAVNDKDVVDVEVAFVCDFAERIRSQRFGNVRIFHVQEPTVVLYIFRKERSLKDLKGSWFVMGIRDNILGIQTEYDPA